MTGCFGAVALLVDPRTQHCGETGFWKGRGSLPEEFVGQMLEPCRRLFG